MIETQLRGLFPPGFVAQGRINLSELMRRGVAKPPELPTIRIEDARPLQAGAASEHQFLETHGFVLLRAPTAVTDWSDPEQIVLYNREVEKLIRDRLYSGREMIVRAPPFVVRRGAGTDNPQYGAGVHQDHGFRADDFQHNLQAFANADIASEWRTRFEQGDVDKFVVLDFWRTTNMAAPLQHMPLALCDPNSVRSDDMIETEFEGIAPNGALVRTLSLRHHPEQRWYYYSAIQPDEVLVFKIFELSPDGSPTRCRSCFHSAVDDPSTPTDAQPRQSCEHRVSVFLLREASANRPDIAA